MDHEVMQSKFILADCCSIRKCCMQSPHPAGLCKAALCGLCRGASKHRTISVVRQPVLAAMQAFLQLWRRLGGWETGG